MTAVASLLAQMPKTELHVHLDVLTNLKRISSHVSALMFPILDEV